MDINKCYTIIQYIINKNQQGYLTPEEFNTVINQAQISFLNYLLGEFQQYQVGRAAPRLAYSNNEITRQRLAPFIKESSLTVNSSGFATYPNDYQLTDAMFAVSGFYRIRFAPQDSQFSYARSVIDPVETNPIFLIKQEGFQFYPTDLATARLSYVSTPEQLNWAYILSVYGLPIWDNANSVNPRWYDVDMLEIISRALRMVGVNLKSGEISQYANEVKNMGQ